MQDEEGGVLRGRFNRPHAMMDLYEYQGTKAAELAGEDYAAQRRVRPQSPIHSPLWPRILWLLPHQMSTEDSGCRGCDRRSLSDLSKLDPSRACD